MRYFDLPATDYKVVSPVDDRTSLLFDGNGYSTYYLPEGKMSWRLNWLNRM